jgi:Lrp/AsnC family leucine-responsive transcriptional regulator
MIPPALVPDDIDRRLISQLVRNARATAAEMAAQVSLSPTAVVRRLKRLEDSGVITGYTVQVDWARMGYGVEALIEVRFLGKTRPQVMDQTAARLPEVLAVFTLSGSYDALVWIRVRDIAHLRDVIDKLRTSPGVSDTRSHVVLAARFPEHLFT